ncbi:hypothetical protein ACFLYR_06125 [Chloroflexota bacterium]
MVNNRGMQRWKVCGRLEAVMGKVVALALLSFDTVPGSESDLSSTGIISFGFGGG